MKLWVKLKNFLDRRARVARLEEAMRFHIERLTEENLRRGLGRAEARRQAQLAFGNVLATREESEDALGWPTLEAWAHDVRVAWRSLSRRPAFALSLVAVLTLGIGATAAVFSLVRGVLLEPLPVPHPEELHLVRTANGEPFELSAPARGVAGGRLHGVVAVAGAPACLVARVTGDATPVRETLQKKILAAELGLLFTRWATLEERAQRWMSNDLATVRVTAGFGALATLLAVIGVLALHGVEE